MTDTNNEEFMGVYYFTNWTDKDRVYLWNNREYHFPAQTRSPLIIASEPLENIQEIRKRFAYRLAEEVYLEGKDFKTKERNGGLIPPTYSTKVYEPLIQRCLEPLPIRKATVVQGKKDDDRNYKATKAIGEKDNPNFVFAEENKNPQVLGEMPGDRVVA